MGIISATAREAGWRDVMTLIMKHRKDPDISEETRTELSTILTEISYWIANDWADWM